MLTGAFHRSSAVFLTLAMGWVGERSPWPGRRRRRGGGWRGRSGCLCLGGVEDAVVL